MDSLISAFSISFSRSPLLVPLMFAVGRIMAQNSHCQCQCSAGGPCPDGWTFYKEFCYKAIFPTNTANYTYAQATTVCSANHATVVSIHSAEENELVLNLAMAANPNASFIWLGLRRAHGGRFYWADWTSVDWANGTGRGGQFPWAPPAEPDRLPYPGDVTRMALAGNSNSKSAGRWDDTTEWEVAGVVVCKRPLKRVQFQSPLPGWIYMHDPSAVIRANDSNFYVYSTCVHDTCTEGPYALRAYPSPFSASDLVSSASWNFAGNTFGNGTPRWVFAYSKLGGIGGPDISYHRGQWWMYWCANDYGQLTATIGLATSPSGMPNTWQDRGEVIRSGFDTVDTLLLGAIDPNLFVDELTGRWWLQWGTNIPGIKQVELDPNTGMIKVGAEHKLIASRLDHPPNESFGVIEAGFLYKKGNYYYLFVSFDHCCYNSTAEPLNYSTRYGRSNSPNGPFVDRDGCPMLKGCATILLASQQFEHAPGGASVYTDDNGDTVIAYHFYDLNESIALPQFDAPNYRHKLGIKYVNFTVDGWPYVQLP